MITYKSKIGDFAIYDNPRNGRLGRLNDNLVAVRVIDYSNLSTEKDPVVQIETIDFNGHVQILNSYERNIRILSEGNKNQSSEFNQIRMDILDALNSGKSADEILLDVQDLVTN